MCPATVDSHLLAVVVPLCACSIDGSGPWFLSVAPTHRRRRHRRRPSVEFEDDAWVHAFELSWSLTQLSLDIVSAVLCAVDTLESEPARAETIQLLGRECVGRLTAWVEAQGDVAVSERPGQHHGQPYTDHYSVASKPVTFHLPLSRLVAITMRRCCASARVDRGVDPSQ